MRGDEAEFRELREREDDEKALSDERREQLQRKLERAHLKLGMPEHREEIRCVKELLELAKRIRVDSKAQELRQFVRGLLDRVPPEKLLIFTEYTDPLDYLRDEVLSDVSFIAQIYGSVSPEERQAEEERSQRPGVHLMLAADAAGEGLNLQFCQAKPVWNAGSLWCARSERKCQTHRPMSAWPSW